MDDALRFRLELLQVIGAVGAIRQYSTAVEGGAYVERELDVIQSAAHRLLEYLDAAELPYA